MTEEPRYTIEARSLSIVGGIAGHDFWVLRDEQGRAVAELHGLATDRETGRYVPIGTDQNRHSLRVWHFVHDADYAGDLGVRPTTASYIADGQQSRTVLSAGREEVMARWNAAVAAQEPLNALDLNYPNLGVRLFGQTVNSNSTYRTLGEIMGVSVRDFPGVMEPGIRNRMISPEEIERMRNPDYPVLDAPMIREGNTYRRFSALEPQQQMGDAHQPTALAAATVPREGAALQSSMEKLGPQERELYQRIAGVAQTHGGFNEEQIRNLAAAGVAAYKADPVIKEAQDVSIHGDRLYIGYFPNGREREPNFHASLKTDEAARTPAEQSLQQVAALERQWEQQMRQPQIEPNAPMHTARAV